MLEAKKFGFFLRRGVVPTNQVCLRNSPPLGETRINESLICFDIMDQLVNICVI